MNQIKRLIEYKIQKYGKFVGCWVINGPKYVGKSTTSSFFCKSKILLTSSKTEIKEIETKPWLALDGEKPRLIDEWQHCDFLWDLIKQKVDEKNENLYFLCGSATPRINNGRHTGAGRFSILCMET